MTLLADAALDAGLNYVRTNATVLHICSAEPANYAGIAAVTLGNKTSPSIAAPSDRTPSGREIVVAAITDGNVTATGTTTYYAIASVNELLVTGVITSQAVTSGNTFTTTAFAIGFPDAVSA